MRKLLLVFISILSVLPLVAQITGTSYDEKEVVPSVTDSTASAYAARIANLKEHYEEIIAEKDAHLYNQENFEMITYMCAVLGGLIFGSLIIIYYSRSHNRQIHELTEEKREIDKERKRLEKELREANATADVKTKFIQQITHEIRTPLNAINGFTQIMCDTDMDMDKDELKGLGNLILENSSNLATILGDIIYISDAETNKLSDLNIERINIQNFTDDIIDVKSVETYEYNPLTGKENALPHESYMYTDSKALHLLLSKLISNAIKFGDAASLKIVASKKMVTIFVCDSGAGVPEGEEDKIFDLFYKTDSFKPGAGLGLCVARSLAHRLGGEVIYAPINGMSCFKVTILRSMKMPA